MLAIFIPAWARTQPTYPTDFSGLGGFLAEQLGKRTSTFNTLKWILENLWTASEIQQSNFEPKLHWFRVNWDDSHHILGSFGEMGYLIQGMVPFHAQDGHWGCAPEVPRPVILCASCTEAMSLSYYAHSKAPQPSIIMLEFVPCSAS